jgi:hypothetical protein
MASASDVAFPILNQVPQNALTILHQQKFKFRIKPSFEKKLKQDYLRHYFQPWLQPYIPRSRRDLRQHENNILTSLEKNPGWNENMQRHSRQWINAIKSQINWQSFPNQHAAAIVTSASALRILPTVVPSYGNPKKAGQGAPFDNLQVSVLYPNLPIYILHTTQDGAWGFVVTPDHSVGWVKMVDVANVNKKFQNQWVRKRYDYLSSGTDGAAIQSKNHQFYFHSRIGQLYPLMHHHANSDEILIALRDMDGKAHIRTARVSHKILQQWPLRATSENIAKMANHFLGQPYGWGEAFNYRDCSSTTKDLFSLFAIWLPRHSTEQPTVGVQHDIAGMNNQEKKALLLKQAVPFFTLLVMNGHVLLYIGQWNHILLAFHSPWGVHSENVITHQEGRIVIGKTSITPINLGKGYLNIPKTWLSKLKVFSLLVPRHMLDNRH